MEFEIKPLAMICGRAEPESRVFRKIDCARGVYLVAVQDAAADHVYYHNPKDTNSDGFGGATLEFRLEDGSVYKAKGPWKINAEALLKDTGVDVTDKYSTFVVIGRDVRFGERDNSSLGCKRFITDVVYQDDGWKVSRFDRDREVLSTLPPGKYYFYLETHGGSHSGQREVLEGGIVK